MSNSPARGPNLDFKPCLKYRQKETTAISPKIAFMQNIRVAEANASG